MGKLKTTTAILYNHESLHRPRKFFTSKVILYAQNFTRSNYLDKKSLAPLELFNPDIKVDMGYALDYVKAMLELARKSKVGPYVISSGNLITVREFSERVFENFSVPLDNIFYKTVEPRSQTLLYGNHEKVTQDIGWLPTYTGTELIDRLCSDYKSYIL
jgi:GDPmannose 4,6-dehydratase